MSILRGFSKCRAIATLSGNISYCSSYLSSPTLSVWNMKFSRPAQTDLYFVYFVTIHHVSANEGSHYFFPRVYMLAMDKAYQLSPYTQSFSPPVHVAQWSPSQILFILLLLTIDFFSAHTQTCVRSLFSFLRKSEKIIFLFCRKYIPHRSGFLYHCLRLCSRGGGTRERRVRANFSHHESEGEEINEVRSSRQISIKHDIVLRTFGMWAPAKLFVQRFDVTVIRSDLNSTENVDASWCLLELWDERRMKSEKRKFILINSWPSLKLKANVHCCARRRSTNLSRTAIGFWV